MTAQDDDRLREGLKQIAWLVAQAMLEEARVRLLMSRPAWWIDRWWRALRARQVAEVLAHPLDWEVRISQKGGGLAKRPRRRPTL